MLYQRHGLVQRSLVRTRAGVASSIGSGRTVSRDRRSTRSTGRGGGCVEELHVRYDEDIAHLQEVRHHSRGRTLRITPTTAAAAGTSTSIVGCRGASSVAVVVVVEDDTRFVDIEGGDQSADVSRDRTVYLHDTSRESTHGHAKMSADKVMDMVRMEYRNGTSV